jgi:hypothetical protein
MFKMYRKYVALVLALLMSFSVASAALANDADVRISLKGSSAYPNAKGAAKYRDRGGEREFQVEVENIKSLAGKTLTVLVGDANVGSMRVSSLGIARLNLNTTRGQAVPVIRSGSVVKVKTSGGVLVVSGRFP